MELKKSVHIGLTVKEAPGGDPRVLRFCASDETPDRDGDVILVSGWKLATFNKNPVFMWSHDYARPPLGKVVHSEIDIRNKMLITDVRFASMAEMAPDGNPSEHAKFVETIYNLYKYKYLSAVSVGCKYLKYEKRNDGDQANREMYSRGNLVQEAELWELSGCGIPSNPSALQMASTVPGVEKEALEMVIKSFTETEKPADEPAKVEEKAAEVLEAKPVETKAAEPDEQKEGRRLSRARIALIDELKVGLTEFDEAIESLKGCRGKMEARIKALENGSPEEPDEENIVNDDTEKGDVIHFVE